jgi:phosphatidylglycerophosphatase A
LKSFARLIATWFYCGYFPVAPGTVGSLAAVAIAWILHRYADVPAPAFALMAVLLSGPGIWAAGVTAREEGREDPGIVVVDEVVGQWLTIAGATSLLNWRSWLLAFALFRIFDILKPFPIRRLEKWPGGLGIVADDALAGIYGAAVMLAAGYLHLY